MHIGDENLAGLGAATEALDLGAPRGLAPSHAAALTARAHTHHDLGNHGHARDDAEAALRIARSHGLVWHELDALEALGDDAAHALRARLIPPDLDRDPLGTIEREVAARRPWRRWFGRRP